MSDDFQRTFIMIKPDGVQRGLVGEIIGRLERKGLRLAAMKMVQVDKDLAEAHYAVHKERPFFSSLIKFITSSPVVAMVWEGRHAVNAARTILGSTDGVEAEPGSIRGDFGLDVGMNLCHGSDSPETAASEIALWFGEYELLTYTRAIDAWIVED